MTRYPNPPRWAEWLLRRCVRADRRDAVVGDLREEFLEYQRPLGAAPARRWYVGQVLRSLWPALAARVARVSRSPDTNARSGAAMLQLANDVRYATRALAKTPLFTTSVLFTLALGIGANTAVFSVVHGVLVRGLPYEDPSQLVRVWEARNDGQPSNVSPQDLLDLKAQSEALEGVAGFTYSGFSTVSGERGPARVRTARVSAGFFGLLGVRPIVGRGFVPAEDDYASDARATVVSYGLWQSRFGADPDIIGRSVAIDGHPHAVVGVLPPDFQFAAYGLADQPELWVPLRISPRHGRGGHWLQAVGRLSPGAELRTARAEATTISAQLEWEYPESNTGWRFHLQPFQESIVGRSRAQLWLLLGAVAIVLAIASANVANLMLARNATRRGEIAVRGALGASRRQVIRFLLAENLLLALGGGVLGLLLARWGLTALVGMAGDLPRAGEISIDTTVLAFTLLVAVGTGVATGLFPALAGTGASVREGLGEAGRGGTLARRGRSTLIVTQVAMTVVLLIGAGLFLRSFARLTEVDPGLNPTGAIALEVVLPGTEYDSRPQIGAFYEELLEEIRGLPGVLAAGAVNNIPFKYDSCDGFALPDRPAPPPGEGWCAHNQLATPGYLNAMGIPLLEGRDFTVADHAETRQVILVNDVLAERFWPGRSAVGRVIRYNGIDREIVGVTRAVRRQGLDRNAEPEMIIPHRQEAWDTQMFVVVRTAEVGGNVVGGVRGVVSRLDPNVPIGLVSPMSTLVADSVAKPRFRAVLLSAFAGVALALAVAGIYGVIGYTVVERTHEIGLRVALGAPRSRVLRLIARQGLGLTLGGIALGLAGAWGATRTVEGLLFDVAATDPITFLGVPLLLIVVAWFATYLPARRAAMIDPVVALRRI